MTSEESKTHEIPIPSTSVSVLPTTPPKRFLGTSPHFSPAKKLVFPTVPSAVTDLSPNLKLQPATSQLVTPPKLIRFPTVLLTPVDIARLAEIKGEILTPSGSTKTERLSLPPPPPLIKMPITTRKDRRAVVTAKKARNDSESTDDTSKQEPPRKRARVAEKSGESSRGSGESTTPRKIIQEIFGPDKSKRPKGKGRKKRRGPVTPKKKILADEVPEDQNEENEEVEGQLEEDHEEEDQSLSLPLEETEEKNSLEETNKIEEHHDHQVEILSNVEDTEELQEDDELKTETQENAEGQNSEQEEAEAEDSTEKNEIQEEDEDKGEHKDEDEKGGDDKEDIDIDEQQGDAENDDGRDETASIASSSSRRVSRRKAKVVANQRLKRLSQSGDISEKEDESASGSTNVNENEEEEDNKSECQTKEATQAAGVLSRRSTTEGSSKSGSSVAQPDSESSAGASNSAHNSNELEDNRRQHNETPYSNSNLSEEDDDEDDHDRKYGGVDIVSISDMQDHKDSDVDSTYSWKPVRAAAAAALELVTKNQGGSGSTTGLPGDAEAKAAAAAERRARKINRYKGRSRRSLLFKSSSSKKYTAVRSNRYTAQPTIAPKVFHHGHYFQAGDIVIVELADGTPLHGQIRGIMMDHFGEISAGIRFLAPKHPVYAFMEFEPNNYAYRYDIPEKLIKIEYVNFVMHLNLDHFDGHPSFTKIEKQSLYTRMGKCLQKSYAFSQFDDAMGSSTDSEDDSSSTSSGSGHGEKKKDENKDGRRRHISDTSTTDPDDDENDKEKIDEIKEEHDVVDEEEESNTILETDSVDVDTKMEVETN